MGSAFTPGRASSGVIPQAMEDIFTRIQASADAEFVVRVGFVEIYQASTEQPRPGMQPACLLAYSCQWDEQLHRALRYARLAATCRKLCNIPYVDCLFSHSFSCRSQYATYCFQSQAHMQRLRYRYVRMAQAVSAWPVLRTDR